MSFSALVMMVVYLSVISGGLLTGVAIMATHRDEEAGCLPPEKMELGEE
ncbi:hypothetical protein KRX54_01530 [Actinomycetaceae bacterium TAE3-ERU4]|nr:hypothetical protein [Actinomycetaceae bacterium TAE3-ERU4]